MSSRGENHFQTPLNKSYACNDQVEISLHDYMTPGETVPNFDEIKTDVVQEATVYVWDVKMQPFELDKGQFSECEYAVVSLCPNRKLI